MEGSPENANSLFKKVGERITELEERSAGNIETAKMKTVNEKNKWSLPDMWDTTKHINTWIFNISRKTGRNRAENI